MNLGRWTAFLLLPLLLLLERFAYYGMRASFFQELLASGELEGEAARTHILRVTWLTMVTPLLGGLVAIALKPRWTLVAGAAITAVGYGVLVAAGAGSFAAFLPLAIGLGLFRPAVFATAAISARDPEESARGALFVTMYAATNLAGFAAPLIATSMPRDGEVRPFAIFTMAGAALLALAMLLAAAVAFAPRLGDEREPADPPFRGRAEIGAVVVMALLLPATLAMPLADGLQFEPFASSQWGSWLFYMNPVSVLAVAVLAAGGLAAAAYIGRRVPALYLAGAGMVLVTLGCLPLLALAGPTDAAKAGALASVVLVAFGEALVNPLALSRLAGGTHPRATTLAVALWLVMAVGVSQILTLMSRTAPEQIGSDASNVFTGTLLAIAAVGTLFASVGVILLQRFGAAKLWTTPPPAADGGALAR